jgi:hypothetical protein
MQKARGQAVPKGTPPSHRLRARGFRFSILPWTGFFPPFGRPTGFAIGRHGVLSLAGWSPPIRAGFPVSDPTRGHASGSVRADAYGALTRSGGASQRASAGPDRSPLIGGPTTPPGVPGGLGWSPFARRYWGSRGCFPFLRVLRCFSSPGLCRASRDRCVLGRSPARLAACRARFVARGA